VKYNIRTHRKRTGGDNLKRGSVKRMLKKVQTGTLLQEGLAAKKEAKNAILT